MFTVDHQQRKLDIRQFHETVWGETDLDSVLTTENKQEFLKWLLNPQYRTFLTMIVREIRRKTAQLITNPAAQPKDFPSEIRGHYQVVQWCEQVRAKLAKDDAND